MGEHPGFTTWLHSRIRKAGGPYALADDDLDDENSQAIWKPVPPEFFAPEFTWTTMEAAQARVNLYLAGLTPAINPYLRTAEDMVTHGFDGTPYGP